VSTERVKIIVGLAANTSGCVARCHWVHFSGCSCKPLHPGIRRQWYSL